MPTSRSPKANTKAPAPPPPRPRLVRLLVLVGVLAVLIVILVALPASLIKRFLPRDIAAEDFSGTLWHGSAGKITWDGRDAGALEWHLHPASLATLTLSANLHWVKIGFVADGHADVGRQGLTARDVQGGGPISDLTDLGLAPGWRGVSDFKFSEIKIAFDGARAILISAVGDADVADLASPQLANGSDLGGYALHVAGATAQLNDTGGPLEARAEVHYSANDRTAMLSGTLKERVDASPALRKQLDNLTQMHARDADGRIPVDFEFTL